jgi:hypothetical protein
MSSSNSRLAVALALLAGWHLLLRAHGGDVPLITDEGEYAVAARAWAEGGLPYRDAFSQKPPVTFMLYRLPLPPRATATLFSLGTMLALFLMLPASLPLAVRLSAPAAYASLSTLPLGDYGFPANTEGFLNLFTSLSVLFLIRRRAALAGLFVGLALMTKQTALYTGLVVMAMTFILQGRRALLHAVLSSAAFPLSFALYFAANGALPEFLSSVYTGNARYAAVLLMTGALEGQLRWFLTALLPWLLLFFLPALGLLAWGLHGLEAGKKRPLETTAVLWLGGSVAGALTGLFLFPHYFLAAAPALSLCAALGAAKLAPKRRALAPLVLALWPALCAPRLYFTASAEQVAVQLLHPNPLRETRFLGLWLAGRAQPQDELYVFGSEGALFAYSGLRPATPYTLSYGLTLFPESRARLDEEYARLRERKPKWVVWSCQPLSTLISNQASADFARKLAEAFLDPKDYRFLGTVPVDAAAPRLEEGKTPDFTPGDRLLVFAREDAHGRR